MSPTWLGAKPSRAAGAYSLLPQLWRRLERRGVISEEARLGQGKGETRREELLLRVMPL